MYGVTPYFITIRIGPTIWLRIWWKMWLMNNTRHYIITFIKWSIQMCGSNSYLGKFYRCCIQWEGIFFFFKRRGLKIIETHHRVPLHWLRISVSQSQRIRTRLSNTLNGFWLSAVKLLGFGGLRPPIKKKRKIKSKILGDKCICEQRLENKAQRIFYCGCL